MADTPDAEGLPPSLRFLKALVIVLTLTMIGGVITVVWLLVTRMPQPFRATPTLPDSLQLPEGTTAAAVTSGQGWIAVVTTNSHILIFAADGTLRQDIPISVPTAAAP